MNKYVIIKNIAHKYYSKILDLKMTSKYTSMAST